METKPHRRGCGCYQGVRFINKKQPHLPFWLAVIAPLAVKIPFEFNWLARRNRAGARLRLTIAPLNSPNYQKNFNTGGRIGYERIDDARIAPIRIFHDARRPSQLQLPLAAARAAGP